MGERWAGKRREFQWPLIIETTALGSAFAAGLAVRFYKDLERTP